MKKKVLIFLSLLALNIQGEPLKNESYGQSFLYHFGIQPFFNLEEFFSKTLGLNIINCTILEETPSLEDSQKYDGLGSCIFDSGIVFTEDEQPQTKIRVNVLSNRGEVNSFILEASPLSLTSLWASYRSQIPLEFFLKISLEKPRSLDNWIYSLLSNNFQTFLENSNVSKLSIHRIELHLSPLLENLMDVEAALFNEEGNKIYKYSMVTNYSVGTQEFFLASKDQHLLTETENPVHQTLE